MITKDVLKKMYERQLEIVSKDDLMYETYVKLFKISAKKVGRDFYKWFEKISKENLETCIVVNKKESKEEKVTRTYQTGFNSSGGLALDASEFDVKNVYEAIKLFEKITGM